MNLFLHFLKTIAICYYVPIQFTYLKLFVVLQTLRHTLFFYKLSKLKIKNLYWLPLFYKYMLTHKRRMNIYCSLIIMKLFIVGFFLMKEYLYQKNKYDNFNNDIKIFAQSLKICVKWEQLLIQNKASHSYLHSLAIIYCFCVSELSFVSLNAKINYSKNQFFHCLLGTFYLICVIVGLYISERIQGFSFQILVFQNYLIYVYKDQIKAKNLKFFIDLVFIIFSSYQVCRLSFLQFFGQMKQLNFVTCCLGLSYLVLILNYQIQRLQKKSKKNIENIKDQQGQERARQIQIIRALIILKQKNANNFSLKYKQKQAKTEIQDCAICFENLNQNQIFLDCKHSFHQNCIQNWFVANKKENCPICRCKFIIKEELDIRQIVFLEQ